MKVDFRKFGDSIVFKPEEKSYFYFLLSDFSAFGNPAKKPLKIRGNYRKCNKILLDNQLDEFEILLSKGEYFAISDPYFTCKETEPVRLTVTITVPAGNAIRVFSIDAGYNIYLVNDGEDFIVMEDHHDVERITGSYF